VKIRVGVLCAGWSFLFLQFCAGRSLAGHCFVSLFFRKEKGTVMFCWQFLFTAHCGSDSLPLKRWMGWAGPLASMVFSFVFLVFSGFG
jgi:hypothetical protein